MVVGCLILKEERACDGSEAIGVKVVADAIPQTTHAGL